MIVNINELQCMLGRASTLLWFTLKTNLFIEIIIYENKSLHRNAIYFWCIIFQIVFQVFQTFVCPEGNLDS